MPEKVQGQARGTSGRRNAGGGTEAHLAVDFSDRQTQKAIDILENAGFTVTTTTVSGIGQPHLRIGNEWFQGIPEILKVVHPGGRPHKRAGKEGLND